MRNHDRVAVARQRVLQQAGQLRVAVVDVAPGFLVRQSVNHVAQGQQGFVNVSTFFQPFAAILKRMATSLFNNTLAFFLTSP